MNETDIPPDDVTCFGNNTLEAVPMISARVGLIPTSEEVSHGTELVMAGCGNTGAICYLRSNSIPGSSLFFAFIRAAAAAVCHRSIVMLQKRGMLSIDKSKIPTSRENGGVNAIQLFTVECCCVQSTLQF